MEASSAWVIASIACFACSTAPSPPAEAPATAQKQPAKPVAATGAWQPASALAECHEALKLVTASSATSALNRQLQLACASLVADASCRGVMRASIAAKDPRLADAQVAQRCAESYCPLLRSDVERTCSNEGCVQELAPVVAQACDEPMPPGGPGLVERYGALRTLMLAHDFGAMGDDALVLYLAAAQYSGRVPPPSFAQGTPPLLRVALDPSGAFEVIGPGLRVGGHTLAEIASKVPRAIDEAKGITIVAAPGVQYQQVIQAMDALRELGYENVQFGARD